MHRSLTCSLSSMFESSYDLYVVADFISYSFPYRRSSNLLGLNFILFVSAHLYTAYANLFVASVCPLHLVFLLSDQRVIYFNATYIMYVKTQTSVKQIFPRFYYVYITFSF